MILCLNYGLMIVGVVGTQESTIFVSPFVANTYHLSSFQIVTCHIEGFTAVHIVEKQSHKVRWFKCSSCMKKWNYREVLLFDSRISTI